MTSIPINRKLTSSEINSLIKRFREGDLNAADSLLECFRPLIGKYLNLFFYGKFNREDRDILKFLEMCGCKTIESSAEFVKLKLRKHEAEDIINVSQLALLETAKTYNNIYSYYKFILLKYIRDMIWQDLLEIGSIIDIYENGFPVNKVYKERTEIDDVWVDGITAGEGFCELSKEQRLIIKLCYYDKIPDIHVANQLKINTRELRSRKKEIKELLAKFLNIKTIDKKYER